MSIESISTISTIDVQTETLIPLDDVAEVNHHWKGSPRSKKTWIRYCRAGVKVRGLPGVVKLASVLIGARGELATTAAALDRFLTAINSANYQSGVGSEVAVCK